LRGDDAAGVLVAQALSGAGGKCRAFVGDVAPENLTGEIKQYAPDLLLVVDAVEMGRKPGELAVIPLDLIGGVSFSTHMLPLSIVLDYLSREVGCEVLLVGVQLSSIEFMAAMHPAVAAAVAELIDGLKGMLADCQA
jgi:hydrogenase 3 maturation protease